MLEINSREIVDNHSFSFVPFSMKLIMFQKICIAIGLTLVLAGCAGRSSMHQIANPTSVEPPVMHRMIQQHIVEGETQRADVVAAFGYPSSAFQSDNGRTVWYYPGLGYTESETQPFQMHQHADPNAVDVVLTYASAPLENTVIQLRIRPPQ